MCIFVTAYRLKALIPSLWLRKKRKRCGFLQFWLLCSFFLSVCQIFFMQWILNTVGHNFYSVLVNGSVCASDPSCDSQLTLLSPHMFPHHPHLQPSPLHPALYPALPSNLFILPKSISCRLFHCSHNLSRSICSEQLSFLSFFFLLVFKIAT